MTTPRLLAFGLLLAICPSAFAARDHVPLEQRLTPEQMKATGLDQLTTEQLRLLNRLLDEDRKAVAEEVRKERGNDGPRVTGTLFGGDGLEPVTSTLTGKSPRWDSALMRISPSIGLAARMTPSPVAVRTAWSPSGDSARPMAAFAGYRASSTLSSRSRAIALASPGATLR